MKTVTNETKICESCQTEFACGANAEKCWCFNVNVNPEILQEIAQNYQNCLCENCLKVQNLTKLNLNNQSNETASRT